MLGHRGLILGTGVCKSSGIIAVKGADQDVCD